MGRKPGLLNSRTSAGGEGEFGLGRRMRLGGRGDRGIGGSGGRLLVGSSLESGNPVESNFLDDIWGERRGTEAGGRRGERRRFPP